MENNAMIYLTDYDIYLNTFLCLIDMIVIMELRERIYGRIVRLRGVCAALSVALVALMMFLPGSYRNTYFTLPVSMILLPFYPKNPKKKLLFEVCLFSSIFAYMMVLNDITNMTPRFSDLVITYVALYHAGLWILLFIILKLCRNILYGHSTVIMVYLSADPALYLRKLRRPYPDFRQQRSVKTGV